MSLYVSLCIVIVPVLIYFILLCLRYTICRLFISYLSVYVFTHMLFISCLSVYVLFPSATPETTRRHERSSQRMENSESEFCTGLQRATSQLYYYYYYCCYYSIITINSNKYCYYLYHYVYIYIYIYIHIHTYVYVNEGFNTRKRPLFLLRVPRRRAPGRCRWRLE